MNDLKEERIENLVTELSYLLGIPKKRLFEAILKAIVS